MKDFLNSLSLLLLTLTIATFSSQAVIASQNPEELIKDIFAKTGKENLFKNLKAKSEVESHIDFSEMSKSILAAEFSKRSSTELKWFEATLKEIITKSVYPSAPKFLEGVKITYKKSKISESDAKISSSVSKKGESTDVDYLLKKINGEWKVVDVAIDEESWVQSINEKVQKTIKDKGWAGLKTLLDKRVSELNKKK